MSAQATIDLTRCPAVRALRDIASSRLPVDPLSIAAEAVLATFLMNRAGTADERAQSAQALLPRGATPAERAATAALSIMADEVRRMIAIRDAAL